MKDIYKMKLHEEIEVCNGLIDVLRVPGGWIYTNFHTTSSGSRIATAFVPWHDSGRQIENTGNYEELKAKLKKTEEALQKSDNYQESFIRIAKQLKAAESAIHKIDIIKNNEEIIQSIIRQYNAIKMEINE